ncbi:protein of unknown function [Streptomyces murinus]
MANMKEDINLTKRLLEQFLVVAEEEHFGRAAERLHMSQPPLSQSIQRLERGLGARLFERGPGGVSLTPAGEVFAVDARRLLDAQSAVIERVRRVASGLEGDVRVGYVTVLSHHYLPALLRAAAEELPGLRVHLHQDTPADIAEMVRSGALDLGFLRDPSNLSAEIVSEAFAVERIAAALPHDHRLAGADVIDLAELRDEDFVLPAPGALPALAQQVQLACHEAGFIPARPRRGRRPHGPVQLRRLRPVRQPAPGPAARLPRPGPRLRPAARRIAPAGNRRGRDPPPQRRRRRAAPAGPDHPPRHRLGL